MLDGNKIAPESTIWICAACGKRSRDLFGESNKGWDVSCIMNAVLCYDEQLPNDRWPMVPENDPLHEQIEIIGE